MSQTPDIEGPSGLDVEGTNEIFEQSKPVDFVVEKGEEKLDEPEPLPEHSEILRYFSYSHLPTHLQGISSEFYALAVFVDDELPAGPEKSTALRKLLEGKDAAVRAAL